MTAKFENKVFLVFLCLCSAVFLWLLSPFYGVIFWAFTIAITFYPLKNWFIKKMGDKQNIASMLTLLVCCVIVILPLVTISSLVILEGKELAEKMSDSEIKPKEYIQSIQSSVEKTTAFKALNLNWEKITNEVSKTAQALGKTITKSSFIVGKSTVNFILNFIIMLYLAFFLIRDGKKIKEYILKTLPLGDEREKILFERFTQVTRATLKGNLAIACIQGAIGGVALWLLGVQNAILWAFCMAIAALIPVVGSALIWVPITIYFAIEGDYASAIILILVGVFIGGVIDNLLRPVLIGRQTRLPDYLILISTLGGIALFGVNGFIVGPLIAAIFVVSWSMFSDEFSATDDDS